MNRGRAMAHSPLRATIDASSWNVTWSGWVLFLIGLSIIGSGFNRFRFSFAGLSIHPYLAFVIILLPLLAASRLRTIPSRFTVTLLLFACLYFISTFSGGVAIGEGMKLGASVATILVCAMLVHTQADFVMGVTGMLAAVGVLAFVGISADGIAASGSVEAIESANRNAYSLYALPPLLLGVYILLRQAGEPLVTKAILYASSILVILCIALNTNRSGWLGLLIIAGLMIYERSLKAAIGFLIVGGAIYFLISTLFTTEHLIDRADDLGNYSDNVRFQLITESLFIGIQNPLLGASPQDLSRQLEVKISRGGGAIDTHNVYALLIGGCGIVCFLVFVNTAYSLWTWVPPRSVHANLYSRNSFFEARKLLRYILFMYAFRGLFSAEILFATGFNIAIGLCMGLVVAASETSRRNYVPPRNNPTINRTAQVY